MARCSVAAEIAKEGEDSSWNKYTVVINFNQSGHAQVATPPTSPWPYFSQGAALIMIQWPLLTTAGVIYSRKNTRLFGTVQF